MIGAAILTDQDDDVFNRRLGAHAAGTVLVDRLVVSHTCCSSDQGHR
jgi:hypothetical protein